MQTLEQAHKRTQLEKRIAETHAKINRIVLCFSSQHKTNLGSIIVYLYLDPNIYLVS